MAAPTSPAGTDEDDLRHAGEVGAAIERWWRRSAVRSERAQLPWRRDPDLWGVLVSEVMLCQTQVRRVIPKYEEWMERWPTPAACGAAPLPELLAVWSGLGYPRRAVALRRAAEEIVEHHGGVVPRTYDELIGLPGVGEYTASAVLAFGCDASVLSIDTNIGRVLARAAAGRALGRRDVRAIAEASGGGRIRAQALMDFGATVCVARAPRCDECPLRRSHMCAWRLEGETTALADPAIGTATAGRRQSPFEGSDRQGRGRLLRAAALGPIDETALEEAAGWPGDPARALQAARSLVADGLLVSEAGRLRLAD